MRACIFTISLVLALACGGGSALSDDPVVYVDDDDPAMLDAITQARAHVDVFSTRLKSPLPGESFSVKKAFPVAGGGAEHMWLSQVSETESGFAGLLDSYPADATDAVVGNVYTVGRDELSDWMIIDGNGMISGGYTLRVLLPTLGADDRAMFESLLQPLP